MEGSPTGCRKLPWDPLLQQRPQPQTCPQQLQTLGLLSPVTWSGVVLSLLPPMLLEPERKARVLDPRQTRLSLQRAGAFRHRARPPETRWENRGCGFARGAGGADLWRLPVAAQAGDRHCRLPESGSSPSRGRRRQAEGMPPGVKADGPGGPLSASDPMTAAPLSAKGQKAPTQSSEVSVNVLFFHSFRSERSIW